MSKLIDIAKSTAEQKIAEAEKKRIIEEQEKELLQDRLDKLKMVVIEEVMQLNGTDTKRGKLECSIENVRNPLVYHGNCGFCRIICDNSTSITGERWEVVLFSASIERNEHKHSDESDPVISDDPTVFACMCSTPGGRTTTYQATENTTETFFDTLGKALSFLFQ